MPSNRMKREACVLIVALFLMVFMIGGAHAYPSNNTEFFSSENFNISCEQNGVKSINFISLVTPFNIEPNKIRQIKLSYSSSNTPMFVEYKCGADEKYLEFDKIDFYNSLNPASLNYDGEDYRGFFYGTTICHNDSNNLSCSGWMSLDFVSYSNPSKNLRGNFYISINLDKITRNPSYSSAIGWFILEDPSKAYNNLNENISILESWKTTITQTITNITNSINGLIIKTNNHDTEIQDLKNRVAVLENSTSNGTTIINNTTIIMSNGTNPYLKYLSSSQRKSMVCGYAEDNNLTQLTDLGWNCTITYKTTRGRTTSTCKCKQL